MQAHTIYSIHHYCSIQCMETLTFYSARLFKSENSCRLFERREKQWRTDGKSVGESYYNIQIRHLLLKEYGNPTDRNKRSQQRLAGLYGVQVIILTVLYHPQILQHSKYYCCSGFLALEERLKFTIWLQSKSLKKSTLKGNAVRSWLNINRCHPMMSSLFPSNEVIKPFEIYFIFEYINISLKYILRSMSLTKSVIMLGRLTLNGSEISGLESYYYEITSTYCSDGTPFILGPQIFVCSALTQNLSNFSLQKMIF